MATEFHKTSNFFTAFRKDYGFPNFDREPVDMLRQVGKWGVGIAYITAVLTVTVIIAFLGTRGYSRWRVTLQMIISLGIGFSIIVCVTGVSWQVSDFETEEDGDTMRYQLCIGLNQANITMLRMHTGEHHYTEYHNVRIGWIEIYQAETEYREALMRGWPIGILRIARYISVDMGEMRYMRNFRWSGYAAWIILWTAFSTWLLANILMGSNIKYAAAFLLLTGILQLLACIVYDQQQPVDFYIPMDDGKGTVLRLRYDWMYWVTLFIGIFVILIAAIILVLDYLRPADMNKFFGTTSEFHSPYDDELAQNMNKDIKGIIRRLSTKRVRHDQKKVLNADAERARKTPFNVYASNGNENPVYTPKSMSSILEREGHDAAEGVQSGNEKTDVTSIAPEIHVEMVNFDTDNEHTPTKEYDDADLDSEVESERQSEYGLSRGTSLESDEGLKTRTSSQQKLVSEDSL